MKDSKILNVLKNTNFLKLWSGEIFTYLGDAVIQVALIAWIMNSMNQVGPQMAMVIFFFMLPSFLLGPVAGALTDRFSRKIIMAISNIFRAVLAAGIIYFVINSESVITLAYAFSGLIGIGAAFFYPPKLSILPNIVKSDELQAANALNAGTNTVTVLLGAIIVPNDDLQAKSDNELQKLFEDEVKSLGNVLASYKQPTVVVIHREELPKTATRKVKRKIVKDWYESKGTVGV